MTRWAVDDEVAVEDALMRVPEEALHADPREWPPLAELARESAPRFFVIDLAAGIDRGVNLVDWLREAAKLINRAGVVPKPALAVLVPRGERREAARLARAGAIVSRLSYPEFLDQQVRVLARALPDAAPRPAPLADPPTPAQAEKFRRASPGARPLAKFNRSLRAKGREVE